VNYHLDNDQYSMSYRSVFNTLGNILVYLFDVDADDCFEEINKWTDCHQRIGRPSNPTILVGLVTTKEPQDFCVRVTKEDIKKKCTLHKGPYYEFHVYSDQGKREFHKTFSYIMELYFLQVFQEDVVYYDLDFIDTTKNKNNINNNNNNNNNKNIGDLYHIYPYSNPVKFDNEQDRQRYEMLFSRVFQNKLLLSFIFKQVSNIHRRHRMRVYGYYDMTPSKLISLGFKDRLTEPLFKQLSYSYLDVINLLRTPNIPISLLRYVFYGFSDSFDATTATDNKFWTIDYSVRNPSGGFDYKWVSLKSFTILENASIGGNLEIIQFLVKANMFKLTERCLEFAAALNHLAVVKYLIDECDVLSYSEKTVGVTPILERCIKISKRYNYSDMFEYLIPMYTGNNPLIDSLLSRDNVKLPTSTTPTKSSSGLSRLLKLISK